MKLLPIAFAAAAFAAAPASAANYVLTYTGNGTTPTTANLFITTSDVLNGAGGYNVLSVAGNVNADTVTGIAPINPPGFSTDNVFFSANPVFNVSGLGFLSATATYNLWGTGPGAYTLYGTTNGGVDGYFLRTAGQLTVQAVPEASTWALMIMGFGLMGLAMRRRSQKVSVTYA